MTKLKVMREDVIVEFPGNEGLNYSDKRYVLYIDHQRVVSNDDEDLTFATPAGALQYYLIHALDTSVGVYE